MKALLICAIMMTAPCVASAAATLPPLSASTAAKPASSAISSLGADEAAWRLDVAKTPDPANSDPRAAINLINGKDVAAVQACKDQAMKGKVFADVPGYSHLRNDPNNPAGLALQALAYQINNCLAGAGDRMRVTASRYPVSVKVLK